MTIYAAIAATRFGMGARPQELDRIGSDAQGWLTQQIGAPSVCSIGEVPTAAEGLTFLQTEYQALRRQIEEDGADPEEVQRRLRERISEPRSAHISARTNLALTTEHSFAERWVRFWSNHFSVNSNSRKLGIIAPTLEAEVIRPTAFGKFEDLLIAAETHVAMLIYLDQAISVGPNSRAGQFRNRGINENLAREILELHTVGVNGGYDQDDVEALARILTGWTVGSRRLRSDPADYGKTVFEPRIQEPGTHRLLGRRFGGEGQERSFQALRFLAGRRQTATFIATKLARHFLADDPSERDINHIARAFRDSDGELSEVARAVITAPAAFDPTPAKFKTPEEFLISSLRALNCQGLNPRQLYTAYASLGQAPFSAPSPAGWPDRVEDWASPDAVLKRLDFASTLAERVGQAGRPRERAQAVLGERMSTDTALSISRAESAEQGLTLLFMSPEFQRR
ncbi:MAG: DUF1800 domain-containing protein [Maricaulis sp.]|jgi:uncharacterized protein (DUF1800 family)|uniref:DUF1800 domain-containing protein n=1 Tax=Maricaulis sp. TaxID=1486257 RepID=UPI001B27DEC4|nr:DUF1800 domain-containing protein [Maricaulis sp.]MBO6729506.1 DUF1800 domain-containing protein [Maricaulis sp.]MBO6878895.1 DUF1800 domain-containing protein [Maricaulis sp.]